METSYTYTEDGKCWFSSDERKTITRIRKLKEAHPDEVTILKQPEENDGCIYGYCPKEWVRLSHPIKRELSDDKRAEMAERMKNLRTLPQSRTNEKGRQQHDT